MLTNVAHEIESACAVSRENGNRKQTYIAVVYGSKTQKTGQK
ncbi:hypothetical protein T4A_9116 [Trichinella pseudospiralis]|uniref:Uncharacterized protein n=1 Tax=Trichinella pseudospiralis TaxID=6337 RepID=A0A0V1C4Q9_TRIPS|nr:hypothetical protein T4A_9116 [Trichinella pseudospiralis]